MNSFTTSALSLGLALVLDLPKVHRFVAVPDADHSFSAEKHRVIMLHEIESFLAEHLGASPGR